MHSTTDYENRIITRILKWRTGKFAKLAILQDGDGRERNSYNWWQPPQYKYLWWYVREYRARNKKLSEWKSCKLQCAATQHAASLYQREMTKKEAEIKHLSPLTLHRGKDTAHCLPSATAFILMSWWCFVLIHGWKCIAFAFLYHVCKYFYSVNVIHASPSRCKCHLYRHIYIPSLRRIYFRYVSNWTQAYFFSKW